MRLSDLIKKGQSVLDAPLQKCAPEKSPEKKRVPDAPGIDSVRISERPPVQEPPVYPSQHGPESSGDSPQPSVPTPASSVYDSLPDAIYRAAEQLEILIPQNKQQTLLNAKKSLTKVFAGAVGTDSEKKGLWEMTRNIAGDLAMVMSLDPNLAGIVDRESKPEEWLVNHSINAALITIDLVKRVDKSEYSPLETGAAALLHDIGVAGLGRDWSWNEEDPSFLQHVARGVELLEKMKAPEAVKTMVAQHHERIDGHGFPEGISGSKLLVSSQVLGLAEGFERIMNGLPQHGEQTESESPANHIQATLAKFRKAFDPDILKSFIALRGFYPDSSMVELTNRSICLVIKQNEGFPLRPILQEVMDGTGNHPEKAKIIDLRSNNILSIIRTVTQNGPEPGK